MKITSRLLLAGFSLGALASLMPTASAQSTTLARATSSTSAVHTGKPTVLILRFAESAPLPSRSSGLSQQACLRNESEQTAQEPVSSVVSSGGKPNEIEVDPAISDTIREELVKKLSKRVPVNAELDPSVVPVGSLIVSGCVTQAAKGNGWKRMAGMNLGASRLDAHIIIYRKSNSGLVQVEDTTLVTKGRMILPPLGPVGLATHALAEHRETLSADAKKLGDKIAKRIKTMAEPQP